MENNENSTNERFGLGEHTPITVKTRDSKSPVWDMSQERAFLENLLSQRFNFFLVFFSLTIAGFINSKNLIYAEVILILGAVITYLLAETLKRSQEKLDIILNNDLFLDSSHPAKLVDDAASKDGSKRRIIGYTIPAICKWVLIGGAILHLYYLIIKSIIYFCNC